MATATRVAGGPGVLTPRRGRRWRTGLLLAAPAIAACALLFIAPLFTLVLNSFRTQQGDLTLANYVRFLGDPFYRDILWHTLWIGALTTAGCLVLGYPFAMYLRGRSPRMRNYLSLILLSPLLISMVIRAYGWLVVLGPNGPIAGALGLFGIDPPALLYTDTAVVIGMVHVMFAYMVLPLIGSLDRIDPTLVPAAKGLGANAWSCFWRITLPLSAPGMLAGSLIVFSLTVSSFVTPAILGGPTVKLMPYFVYTEATNTLDWPYAAAIGFILIVVTTLLVAVYSRLLQGRGERGTFA
ncbi:ABC transporter permease [Saccharopolyspora sp. WRP15-2]|uniref:ABC transporter permease n=1 Tax=Saccharopolyspora oryzae TaxID=2997343 RepID=A0ABT4V5A3_9PSEU|nr:ABC transporter permease [Saccharopolyspora oryzae]MDA3629136.1 ABC transporter permease [Saccharopolyspora oryzae]